MEVRLATVTQVSPLRVRLDGASSDSAARRLAEAQFKIGARVSVAVSGEQVTVLDQPLSSRFFAVADGTVLPRSYPEGISHSYASNNTAGFPASAGWANIQTIRKGPDVTQTFYSITQNNTYRRYANSSGDSWSPWVENLHDFNGLRKQGPYATTGAAARNTVGVSSLNANLASGWYDGAGATGMPDGNWWLVQVISHQNGAHWQRQIAYSMTGDQAGQSVFSRRCNGGDPTVASNWSAWEHIAGSQGPWITPTLLNGWIHYQGTATDSQDGYGPWQYRKVGGVVYTRGLISGEAATADHFVTLPAGFRVARNLIIEGRASTGPFEWRTHPDGSSIAFTRAGWASCASSWPADQ